MSAMGATRDINATSAINANHRLHPAAINAKQRSSCARGIALVTALLAMMLLLTILTVVVNVSTARLRRSTQDLRSLQALAAADAGVGWVRALLDDEQGSVLAMLADLATAHSTLRMSIDPHTEADVHVSIRTPAATEKVDHLDIRLQKNPQIAEAPLQVVASASLFSGGSLQSTRTVTTLLRTFRGARPYSEIVGVIDDAGPDSVDSPGDPAGQSAATDATELLLQAYKNGASGRIPANKFEDQRWSDGNTGPPGFLP